MDHKKKFLLETGVTALIDLIPVVGGSITGIYGNIQAERKNRRFEEFMQQLSKELNELQTKINQEYLAKEDFLDVFEQTTQKVISQRSNFKRQALKNNFISGIVHSNVDYDKVEAYEKLIDYLNEDSLTILLALHDPEKFALPTNYINPIEPYSIDGMLKNTFPEMADDRAEECITLLIIQRLINTTTFSSYPEDVPISEILKGQLTSRGRDFAMYISEIEKD